MATHKLDYLAVITLNQKKEGAFSATLFFL
jgi:hypothetical protein